MRSARAPDRLLDDFPDKLPDTQEYPQPPRRRGRRTIGLLTISVAALLLAIAMFKSNGGSPSHWLSSYAIHHDGRWVAPEGSVLVGTPILTPRDGSWVLVGYVTHSDDERVQTTTSLEPSKVRLTLHEPPSSVAAVAGQLFPPQRREAVAAIIRRWGREHASEAARDMLPIFRGALTRSIPIVQRAVGESVRQHPEMTDRVVENFRDRVVAQHLVPLAKDRVLPIVRRHAEQPALDIGRQLWDRASLWRFAWAAVVNKSGLPEEDQVAAEWERFVEEEAIEVFESNVEPITAAVSAIVVDVAADQIIRERLGQAAGEIASDRDTQALVQTVVRDALVRNEDLRRVWIDALSSPQAKAVYQKQSPSLRRATQQINDLVLGSAREGLTPELVRVVRREVLGKDRRWIAAEIIDAEIIDAGPIDDRGGLRKNTTRKITVANPASDYPVTQRRSRVGREATLRRPAGLSLEAS